MHSFIWWLVTAALQHACPAQAALSKLGPQLAPCGQVCSSCKQGGHAVDAAVATALCQGVYNPQASGIGGGGFIMVKAPNGSVEIIDAREPAPSASSQDMFQGACLSMMLCAHSAT